MQDTDPIPLVTLEMALDMAHQLREELDQENINWQQTQVSASLTASFLEALIAFLIWKSRRRAASMGKRVKL